ncbi:Ldh family oxidoreductase [Psychromarinibacter sp. C21-152]|uniref:Ldh family oxidoreductase n=1 Tax=Psychromarinibacter sediminicola TaxID=3033385 RepID=A0AAE3NPH5_9RHOB|nr:Ldh family oxidoreductase [Psychromarinibacter sediminicola]MDF0599622.1 Ldh family oxidoreductase [Psychromarinibacter sediminicola]
MPRDALAPFVRRLMAAAGVDADQAETVCDNLLWNDAAGRRNHGLERLPILLERVRAGLIRCPAAPRWRDLGPSLAHLDAGDCFGQHAGRLVIDRAVALAEETGIGTVGVSHSNFFGSGACFLARAADRGMVGLALSNSFPKVAAHGGRRPVLGTNPLAFGAPRAGGRRLLVDMSTAGLAGSTLRDCRRTGRALPEGLVVDADGAAVTDPAAAGGGALLPAAGAKGFGLALMVEILAGVLTGAGVSDGVGSLYGDFERAGNSGHVFLALDIRRWMPREAWDDRIEGLCAAVAASGAPGDVRLPGELREAELARSDRLGIALEADTVAGLTWLARDCDVAPPWPVPGGVQAAE